MAPQQQFFRATHRVIGVDLPGHGESDKPERNYSIPALADDVAWLCTQLCSERPMVIGHSLISSSAPRSDVARFRALWPDPVHGQVVGSGHCLQLEVPDQVNAMIARFLAITSASV